MGECKDSMTPPPTPPKPTPSKGAKSVLGLFSKKPERPARKNYASIVEEAYGALQTKEDKKAREGIQDAMQELIRLIDIKENELSKEKGREDYNRLALFYLNEMYSLFEHIDYLIAAPSTDVERNCALRLFQHIGNIGAEYAEHK